MRRWLRRRRVPYWQTERWRKRNARFKQLPRAQRCAACLTTWRLVTHHLAYPLIRGTELNWQLVRLCHRHHSQVHWLSRVLFCWTRLFSRRKASVRGLWITTPTVIALTRLFGRRAPHATTVRRAA